MEAFSPDFSEQWQDDSSDGAQAADAGIEDEDCVTSLEEAMEALVERVNAARTIY